MKYDRTLEYPFAFEIIAIPLKEPYGPDDGLGEILNHMNLSVQLIILFLQKIISLKVIMVLLRDIDANAKRYKACPQNMRIP